MVELTPKEGSVLRLLAYGDSAQTIAHKLSCCPHVVHTYCSRLRSKFGVDTSDSKACAELLRKSDISSRLKVTDRQFEILELLVRGFSHKEIAEKLDISWITSMNSASQGAKRLGVRSQGKSRLAEIRAALEKDMRFY